MAVTVFQVRDLLDQLSSKQVSDDTLSANIQDATVLVDHFKQTDASATLVDLAKKRVAVWLSYISYSEGMSFQRGATPAFMTRKEEAYRTAAELYLNMVSSQPVDLDNIKRRFEEAQKAQDPSIISFSDSLAYDS